VRIGSLTAPAGTAATVRLEATDVPAPGLGKVTIDVTYDPSILSLADCAEDPNGLLDAAVCYLAHRSDVVGFTGIRATPGAIGTLPLADITFEVVGTPGQCSDLHVVVVTFTDPDGGSITAPATDGEICVASAPASVLSGDTRPDLRMSVFPVSLDRGHRVFVSEVAACGQQFSGASQGSVALAQGWNAVCYSGATTDVDIATAGISDQISVIYALQADQSWERHVPGRPELSAVTRCSRLGALLVLVAQEGGVTWVFSP